MAEKRKSGGQSKYKREHAAQAEKLCRLGATDREVADFFGVSERTLYRWQAQHDDLRQSLKIGKESSDERVERSLYRRATGYSFDAVKIFQNGKQVPYVEHVPPDTTACIFWLKNRKPEAWRDTSRIDLTNSDRSLTDMFAAAVASANGINQEAQSPTGSGTTIN